ncbi:hypothetical protein B0H14DRAFT_3454782 [Mycena olivaceomarginata]|nr:hypothetical protein B0H14DRAFT_3454782 [Mycena olivaceomarginata]
MTPLISYSIYLTVVAVLVAALGCLFVVYFHLALCFARILGSARPSPPSEPESPHSGLYQLEEAESLSKCKADREYRHRRDQLAAAEALARQKSQSERAARVPHTKHFTVGTYTQSAVNPKPGEDTSFPSTPTISTPSDLSLSAETSPTRLPILLPAFFTPKPIRTQEPPRRSPSPTSSSSEDDMAHSKSVDLFRGNCAPEKAHIWLRTLEGGWKYDTKEEEKLYQFEKGLHPGAQADEWWGELKVEEKSSWPRLLTAFNKKWPKPKAVRRALDIILEDISQNKLSREDLGKLTKDEDGILVLSHIAWAETVRKYVSEIPNGDADMLLKRDIRYTLPFELRRLIPNEAGLDTWEKWLTAVENISLDAIKDAVEEALCALHRHMAALAQSTPPPAARLAQPITRQPTTPYATPAPAYPPRTPWNTHTDDPFGGSTIRPQNNFAKNLLATPASPSAGRSRPASLSGDPTRDVDIARQLSQGARMYPTDTMGTQWYKTDFEAFPFSPGTVPPGSRECYRCGLLTDPPHYGVGPCRDYSHPQVPTRELNIRSIVGQIIHPPRQRSAGISQISEVPYDLFGGLDPDQPLYEAQSENGEEPTD